MRRESHPFEAATSERPTDGPGTPGHTARHSRTDKGELELQTRQYGLSPRARQLLLLIDTQRDDERLARVFPRHELTAYLALLESEGFVRCHLPTTPRNRPSQIEVMRDRALRHLLSALGCAGERFALRVAKCNSREEIETLAPAIASVIEVSHGHAAAQQFTRQVLRH